VTSNSSCSVADSPAAGALSGLVFSLWAAVSSRYAVALPHASRVFQPLCSQQSASRAWQAAPTSATRLDHSSNWPALAGSYTPSMGGCMNPSMGAPPWIDPSW